MTNIVDSSPDGDPTALTAVAASTTQINLAWRDSSANESGFAVERFAGATCTNFVQIATVGANAKTIASIELASRPPIVIGCVHLMRADTPLTPLSPALRRSRKAVQIPRFAMASVPIWMSGPFCFCFLACAIQAVGARPGQDVIDGYNIFRHIAVTVFVIWPYN